MGPIRMVNVLEPKLPVLLAAILYLTVFFYLTFPKAGFKVAAGIPVTVGDLLLFLLILFGLTQIKHWLATFYKFKTVIILLMIPMGFAFLKLGYSDWNYGLLNIGIVIPLIVYPAIFFILLIIYSRYGIPWRNLLIIPVLSFIILSVYALLQLFLGIEAVMIPGLTYNWTDAQNPFILATKNNFYGTYSKIFATYQNGNLFGVNLLLMFPLVFELVYRKSKKLGYTVLAFFITVALLTASRAVWAGVVFYIIARFFLFRKSWGKLTAIYPLTFIGFLMLFVEPLRFRANMFLGKETIPQLMKIPAVENIFKRVGSEGKRSGKAWPHNLEDMQPQMDDLSGRAGRLYKLWDNTFGALHWKAIMLGTYGILPRGNYGITGEMTYAAIFAYLGLVGLFLWSLPVLYSLYKFYLRSNDLVIRGILLGMLTYFFVATVEGAYWLTPTAFNLWLLIGIGWIRWHYLKDDHI